MNDFILYPISIYYYKQNIKKDGSTGYRWDYLRHDGKEQPDLFFTSKKGIKSIYFGKQINKEPRPGAPELCLWWNEKRALEKNGKTFKTNNATGVFMPDINKPGYGHGQINNNRDSVLIHINESNMMIMVFEKISNAEQLFRQWMTGAVRESVAYNNVMLDTESVHID